METLLTELKGNLHITWNDDDTTLNGLIARSKYFLEDITGGTFDYDTQLNARELVLEYCRYVRNNAGDEFSINYHDDILRLSLKVAVDLRGEADVTSAP